MPTALATTSQAKRALRTNQFPALRSLTVHETDSTVLLTGRVPSYYLKQLAQEAVLPFLHGRELQNEVTVSRV
jgi:hypothetical protein